MPKGNKKIVEGEINLFIIPNFSHYLEFLKTV